MRYKLTLRFDGARYHGWQVQANAVTVQAVVQDALTKTLGFRPDVTGCSRTDAGVHARMYCCHFDADTKIPAETLPRAINAHLPRDIAASACEPVGPDFHARYSCRGKEYEYQVYNGRTRNPFYEKYAVQVYRPIDAEALSRAAAAFIGRRDFASFCGAGTDVTDTVRTVYRCTVSRTGDLIRFRVAADGFLFHMVRIMAGTLLFIHAGKLDGGALPDILNAKNRKLAGKTAPAHALFLNQVYYDDEFKSMG